MPRIPLFPVSDLPPGSRKVVQFGRIEVGIFNVGGAFYAYRNVCPHAGAPACEGAISNTSLRSMVDAEGKFEHQDCILRCPLHGWQFDLRTGERLVDRDTRLNHPRHNHPSPDGSENLEKFSIDQVGDDLFVTIPA